MSDLKKRGNTPRELPLPSSVSVILAIHLIITIAVIAGLLLKG